MAYDDELADRVRRAMSGHTDVTERRMFGGLAFLLGGRLAVAVSGQGGLMLRVDPVEEDELLVSGRAEEVVMRGRPMTGWLRVAPESLTGDAAVAEWVARAVARVHALVARPDLTPDGRPAG